MTPLEKEDILFIIYFTLFSLAIGIVIYRLLANLSWLDSFYNATMNLSTVGPIDVMVTPASKIGVGIYSLYSSLFFLIVIGFILTKVL